MKRKKRPAGNAGARPIQIGEQMRQALSNMFLEGAIKDPRVSKASMITVTDVRLTNDLRNAKVLVSIYPADPQIQSEVLEGLESAIGATQREVSSRLSLRFTPKVEYVKDDSIREGAHIESILKELRPEWEPPPEPEVDDDGTDEADEER